MRENKILLLGSIGGGNAGDDAICLALIEALIGQINRKTSIDVYVRKKYLTAITNSDYVQVRWINSLWTLFLAFMSTNLVVLNGGDYIDDYGSLNRRIQVFFLFFTILVFSKLSFKRFIIVNGGYRANTHLGLIMARILLCFVSCFTTRDEDSFSVVKRLNKRVSRGFDTAILLKNMFQNNLNHDYESTTASQKLITNLGISITPVFKNFFGSPIKDDLLIQIISEDLGCILEKCTHLTIHLIALNTNPSAGDQEMIDGIISRLSGEMQNRIRTINYNGRLRCLITQMDKLDAMVCCKYHSAVFSFMLSKPMIAIIYHPKVRAFANEIGLTPEGSISLNEVENGDLRYRITALLNNPDEFKASMPIEDSIEMAKNGVWKCFKCLEG